MNINQPTTGIKNRGLILKSKVIAVCGLPGSGKDTFADILAEITGWNKGTCSDVIYADLAEKIGMHEGDLREVEKESIRHILVAHGDHLTKDDPGFLVRCLMELYECRIIAGVRRIVEFDEIPEYEEGGLTIWVERDSIPHIDDNTEVHKNLCDVWVENNGTIEELKDKAKALL